MSSQNPEFSRREDVSEAGQTEPEERERVTNPTRAQALHMAKDAGIALTAEQIDAYIDFRTHGVPNFPEANSGPQVTTGMSDREILLLILKTDFSPLGWEKLRKFETAIKLPSAGHPEI